MITIRKGSCLSTAAMVALCVNCGGADDSSGYDASPPQSNDSSTSPDTRGGSSGSTSGHKDAGNGTSTLDASTNPVSTVDSEAPDSGEDLGLDSAINPGPDGTVSESLDAGAGEGASPSDSAPGQGGSTTDVAVIDGGTGSASFHCVNWAVNGDNFQTGPLLLSGVFSSDTTYDAVKARALAVENAYTDLLQANSFRMPINEPTVNTASYWSNYKAIIDVGVSKGMKVVIGFWARDTGIGRPADINAWYTMWQTVVSTYVNSPTVYFDIHNEPHGYTPQQWVQQVKDWMAKFPNVPKSRIIVAGTGWDDNVSTSASAFPDMMVEVHDYVFNASFTNPSQWGTELLNRGVQANTGRTIVGEWGTGVVNMDALGTAFITGFANVIHDNHMGSCWWPGLWAVPGNTSSWSLLKMNGSESNLSYSVQSSSPLSLIQHSWGLH